MKLFRFALFLSATSFCVFAHPMGNFSINHYTRIELREKGPELTYILDLAEIPTSELLRDWGNDQSSGEILHRSAERQAESWANGLIIKADSKAIPVKWDSVQVSLTDGAGGMPVLRVVMISTLHSISESTLTFQDTNYANRTGWKEVVMPPTGAPNKKMSTTMARMYSLLLFFDEKQVRDDPKRWSPTYYTAEVIECIVSFGRLPERYAQQHFCRWAPHLPMRVLYRFPLR